MSEILLGEITEFPENDWRVVAIGDFEVGVFHYDGALVAWENNCPHHQGPVCQGRLINRVDEGLLPDQTSTGLKFTADRHIICPWHGYEFNIKTGRHPGDPRIRLREVPVAVRGSQVFAQIPG